MLQGSDTAASYASCFHTLSAQTLHSKHKWLVRMSQMLYQYINLAIRMDIMICNHPTPSVPQMYSHRIVTPQSPCPSWYCQQYQDLVEVFSKEWAAQLSPHWLGTVPLNSFLAAICPWDLDHGGVHRGGTDCWVHQTIHFFCGEKAGSLWPWIFYHGLNSVTTRYSYPLSLVPPVFPHIY